MKPNTVIFIPVSTPSGIGEYMRSLIIAKALLQHSPDTSIHFILNEQVSYIKDCPFQVHTCIGSPTKNSKVVNAYIRSINPDLVVFDASGRAEQFKQAKMAGAKVAFISQHNKKRTRGLKINRLLHTDIHWVVQPDFCMKKISGWQQRKLAFLKKKTPKNIGAVFELPNLLKQQEVLKKYNIAKQEYYIFNAGSGGHKIGSEFAVDIFYQAAKLFYQATKFKCVVVFGSNYSKDLPIDDDVICIKDIDSGSFIQLINAANACIISGGDTLLQAIALKKTCIAAAVSPDQPSRLSLCQQQNLVLTAKLTSESLSQQAIRLVKHDKNDIELTNLKNSLNDQPSSDALSLIIKDIDELFL